MKIKIQNLSRWLFVSSFFVIIMFLFFSNLWSVLTKKQNDLSNERVVAHAYPSYNPRNILDLPENFELAFNDNFRQRNTFGQIYENIYFFLFNEISSNSFLLRQREDMGFLSRHYDGNSDRNEFRYDLIYRQFRGGYGDVGSSIEDSTSRLESHGDFLESLDMDSVIIGFPVKPHLEYDFLPRYIQRSIGREFLEKPIQVRILENLDDLFVHRYILDFFNEDLSENLFPRYNFHWENRSYYTNLIAASIAERFGKNVSPAPDEVFGYEAVYSDIAYLTRKEIDSTDFLLIDEEYYSAQGCSDIENINRSSFIRSNPLNSETILVVGDSFNLGLIDDLSLYYENTICMNINYADEDQIDELFSNYTIDKIVFLEHTSYLLVDGIIDKFEQLYYVESRGIKFRNTNCYLMKGEDIREGWHDVEQWGVWSSETANILINKPVEGDEITLDLLRFTSVDRVTFSYLTEDGYKTFDERFFEGEEINPFSLTMNVTEEMIQGNQIIIQMIANGAVSPNEIGFNSDQRILGVGLADITISP